MTLGQRLNAPSFLFGTAACGAKSLMAMHFERFDVILRVVQGIVPDPERSPGIERPQLFRFVKEWLVARIECKSNK